MPKTAMTIANIIVVFFISSDVFCLTNLYFLARNNNSKIVAKVRRF